MKKVILTVFLGLMVLSTFGQFRNKVNVSLFTGGHMAKENTNNQGYWYGVYGEYMPIKTASGLNLGFAGLASQTRSKSNDHTSEYKGVSTDLAIGFAGGKYSHYFTTTHSSYLGFNLMLKRSVDSGEGLSVGADNKLGKYSADQKDVLISGELNFNLLKIVGYRSHLFPRTQLRLAFQETLSSNKVSFWNDKPIDESWLWNKAAYTAELKQSIAAIGQFDLLVEPKLYVGYYHYKGDKSNWLAIGPEIALKKRGWDDFLSVYFLVKKQIGSYEPHHNSTQFVVGINFNPFNIKR